MFSILQRTMRVAAGFAATTGAAVAGTVDPAQVAAEAAAANKAGLVAHGEQGMPDSKSVSTRNRAEVKPETAKADQIPRREPG